MALVTIKLSSIVPPTIPVDGWKILYRKVDTTTWFTAPGSPFHAYTNPTAKTISFTVPGSKTGELYEVSIQRDCGQLESGAFTDETPCDCLGSYPAGQDPWKDNGDGRCSRKETVAATTTDSNYCFVANTLKDNYSVYGSRIYKPGFTSYTLLNKPTDPDTYIDTAIMGGTIMTNSPQWLNPVDTEVGPMNREGTWASQNCTTIIPPLAGRTVTMSTQYTNTGAARQVFVGLGGDNEIGLKVNGVTILDTGVGLDVPAIVLNPANTTEEARYRFRIWHLVPVMMVKGENYFEFVAEGSGGISDCMAMVVYDNTAQQLSDSRDNTAGNIDNGLNILFQSSDVRGNTTSISTCPEGYSLVDTGTPVCVKIVYMYCNTTNITYP